MKFKNIASAVKKTLPKQEKIYNLVKTPDEMIKNAGDNASDLHTQITNFQKAPNTNFMSSLNKRVPPSKSFQMQKGKDYGLSKDLIHSGHFHLENAGRSSKILSNKIPSKSTFKQSAGVPSLNKYFNTLAPKKMDYRYTDPQTYEYKLQGLTQEKLIRNKMREDGEAANNNKDTNDLDATSKFLKWREQDVNNKASKLQGLARGYLERQNFKEGIELMNADDAEEVIPEGKRVSGVDAIKLGKAKRNAATAEFTEKRKRSEQIAKESNEEMKEQMDFEEMKKRKRKEKDQLIKNKAHTFTPKQRAISKIYANDIAYDKNLTQSDAAKYYDKAAKTLQKAARTYKPTAKKQYKTEQFLDDVREKERQIRNERENEKFRALPEKEQKRLREEYALQQAEQHKREHKQRKKEDKQRVLDYENRQRAEDIQRESDMRSSIGRKSLERALKSSKFENVHNELLAKKKGKEKNLLKRSFNAIKNSAQQNKELKEHISSFPFEGAMETKDEEPESSVATSVKARTDRKKTKKMLEAAERLQESQKEKNLRKREKLVDFYDSEKEDDGEKHQEDYNFSEADKKLITAKQNRIQDQIFESESKMRSIKAAMQILKKSNLTESSVKISKELRSQVLSIMKSTDPNFSIHGSKGVKAVYQELTREQHLGDRTLNDLKQAKQKVPDLYKKAKDKKNQSANVANKDGYSPSRPTTRSQSLLQPDFESPIGGGGRRRSSKEELDKLHKHLL